MKKYVSRKKTRAALILLFTIAVLDVVGVLFSNIPLVLIAMALLIPFAILDLSANRCPHCGAFFRDRYWSKPTAGYCNKCGEVIEFDDCRTDD